MNNFTLIRVSVAALAFVSVPEALNAQTIDDKVGQLLEFCLASGEQQKLEGALAADGKVRLIGSNLSASGDLTFTREEWSGVIGGISVNMTDLQAEQANRVRECLEPARAAIFEKILNE